MEAIKLYTQLVASYPARFQDDLQSTRNNLENLKRQQDLATGQKRAIAPDDRTYLNASDPNTPLRRSVVRLWPTFAGRTSGIGPLLGTGFVVRREGDRAWIATARHVVLSQHQRAPHPAGGRALQRHPARQPPQRPAGRGAPHRRPERCQLRR